MLDTKVLPPFNLDGRMRLRTYNLNEIMKTLVKTFAANIPRGIDLRVELAHKELAVMADFQKLAEAFFKLVENAVEAMTSHGTLTLSSREVFFNKTRHSLEKGYLYGPWALVSITDTGAGMERDALEKLYEPFFTTKEGQNRGLGFPIASRIIEDHSGVVSIETASDTGTTVNVYIPLVRKSTIQAFPIPLPASFGSGGNLSEGDRSGTETSFI